MLHALQHHNRAVELVPLSESPRWQLISDEHTGAIQTVEESLREKDLNYRRRCLLCQPRVGDSRRHHQMMNHLKDW